MGLAAGISVMYNAQTSVKPGEGYGVLYTVPTSAQPSAFISAM